MVNISTNYLGLQLRSPIIVGSSGLTEKLSQLEHIEKAGAGAVVLKSIFEEEIISELNANLKAINNETFVYPESLDYYEDNFHIDDSTSKYLELIANAKKSISIPVIASINCITPNEWTYFPKQIELAGADALELNIFLLPSDSHRSAEDCEKIHFDIIKEVKKDLKIPVSVKISNYSANLSQFICKLSQTDIDGLVLFNRSYSPDIDLNTLEIKSFVVLSDENDYVLPLRWVAISRDKVKCSIASSTGVHHGKEVAKMILAGADAVQIVSAFYKNGFYFLENIHEELKNFMRNNNYTSLDQFRGKLSMNNSQNPAAFERVQFMKYFRGYREDFE